MESEKSRSLYKPRNFDQANWWLAERNQTNSKSYWSLESFAWHSHDTQSSEHVKEGNRPCFHNLFVANHPTNIIYTILGKKKIKLPMFKNERWYKNLKRKRCQSHQVFHPLQLTYSWEEITLKNTRSPPMLLECWFEDIKTRKIFKKPSSN